MPRGPIFSDHERARMVRLHRDGKTDGQMAKILGRSRTVVCRERAAAGLSPNADRLERIRRSMRMRAQHADPEFASKCAAARQRPDVIERQRTTMAETQRIRAEERDNARVKIPQGDPLLTQLWKIHGADYVARREREARA